MDTRVKSDSKDNQKLEMILEYKSTEIYLSLRGVPELLGENIYQRIVDALAGFLNEQPDEIKDKMDLIYRVNSIYAEKKNIPRDVIVQLLTKKMKEDILREQYKTPLEIDGKMITVMKELPRKEIMEQLDQITYKQILPSIQQDMIPFPELIRFVLQKRLEKKLWSNLPK